METDYEDPILQDHKPASPSPTSNPIYLGIALSIAFATGLAVGLLGRPMLIRDIPVQVVVTVVPNTSSEETAAQKASSDGEQTKISASSEATDEVNAAESETGSTSVAAEVSGSPTPTLMEFVMADARHIQGDEAAPVTVIEFSDFK